MTMLSAAVLSRASVGQIWAHILHAVQVAGSMDTVPKGVDSKAAAAESAWTIDARSLITLCSILGPKI
jgi:hypothetical protein